MVKKNIIKPHLIIIAGPNGSGKTSITAKILEHQWIADCKYINPDFIARDVYGDWNAPEAVLKAVRRASELREKCLKSKESILFETVMSAPDKVDYILRAQKAGYFIRLFFVSTDSPVINAGRIARRVMEGGHNVPIDKIISRFYKSIANCCVVARFVNRLYIYDNSPDFEEPRLLFRATDGKIQKKYGIINEWAKGIYNSVNR